MANIKYQDVKNAFKEGATPNESDYQKLITLARVGGQALGATDDAPTTLKPGNGLEIKDNKLAVRAADNQGLSSTHAGVGVIVDNTSVKTGKDGLEIALKNEGGLSKDGGLHVVTGPGLSSDKSGLQIALVANKSGLKKTGGLAVVADGNEGLEIKNNKLAVKISPTQNKFLEKKKDGLALSDDGIRAIKEALTTVSIEALGKAKANTETGFKKDTDPAATAESVEGKIAAALNEAYVNGLNPGLARQQLEKALKTFCQDKKFAGGVAMSPADDSTRIYSQKGALFESEKLYLLKVGEDGQVAPYSTQWDRMSGWASGAYAVMGKVDSTGNPDKNGDHCTENALMVVAGPNQAVGGAPFGICVGGWDLASVVKGKKDGDGWTNIPAPDPLQFKKGHDAMEGLLVRPTIKAQPASVPVAKGTVVALSDSITPVDGEGPVYYLPGVDGGTAFKNLGTLDHDKGTLTLTGNTAGTVTVLAVQAHKKTGNISAASELTVTVTKVAPPYKPKAPTIDFIPTEGVDLSTLAFFDSKGEVPAGHLKFELVTKSTTASVTLEGSTLKPVKPYNGGEVVVTATTPETAIYSAKQFTFTLEVAVVQNPGAYTIKVFGTVQQASVERTGNALELTIKVPEQVTKNLTAIFDQAPTLQYKDSWIVESPYKEVVDVPPPGIISKYVWGKIERAGKVVDLKYITHGSDGQGHHFGFHADKIMDGGGWNVTFDRPVTIPLGTFEFKKAGGKIDIKLQFG